eukprot:m.127936 g.127936  ORF g.127936 m.127936 type:complete len:139 (+) comp14554_c0_seq6:118-534(+)
MDLTSLDPQQLQQVYTSLSQEVEYLTNSLAQLKSAQEKFNSSKKLLSNISPENNGKETLVPMTSSLYVPGIIDTNDKVLVDVGTGYYIEQTVEAAGSFFERRVQYLKTKIQELQPLVIAKMREKNMVEEVIKAKMTTK